MFDIIAMLCAIHAGDTHQYGSTVSEINYAQMSCHAFFAKCSKKKDFDDCIIQRKVDYDKELKRLRDKK